MLHAATGPEEMRRILAAFDAASRCKHNVIAYTCGERYRDSRKMCNPGPALRAITESGRTTAEVIEEFLTDGRISHVEIERHIRGVLTWRKVAKISKLAGTVIAVALVVTGGATLTLRLFRQKDK